ncbi:RNA-splicing factor [Coemansia sp. RSA 552]|nr:RNA-splicing factor [Coemansia sp. RSA 552]
MSSSNDAPAQPLFRKGRRREKTNLRKRVADEAADLGSTAADAGGEVVKGDGPRAAKQAKAVSAVSSGQSKLAEPADNDASSNGDHVDYHFKRAMVATRTEDDSEGPAETKSAAASDEQQEPGHDGLYKGKAAYTRRLAGSGTRRAGPVRGPANVRTTNVVDYQPNVCKDYKETGYCGYGDSCIFLHDRGVYKTGWQLEQEFEASQQGVRRDNPRLWQTGSVSDDGDGDGNSQTKKDKVPFACLICREPFKNPVVTKCKHYFCEACALARYRKSPKCFACGAATAGVFKRAKLPASDGPRDSGP